MKLLNIFYLLICFSAFSQTQDIQQGLSLMKKSEQHYQNSQYDSAYYFATKSLKLFETFKADSLSIKAALLSAKSKNKSEAEDSISYLNRAEELSLRTKNWEMLAETYYTQGGNYYSKFEYGAALPLYIKVDSISELYDFKNEITVNAILKRAEISRLSFTEESTVAAEALLGEALEMAKEIRSEALIHKIYMHYADISGLKGNFEDVKRYADLAFDYYLKEDNVGRVSRLYWIYASYYMVTDKIEKAAESLKERITYLRKKDDSDELASALVAYANFYRIKLDDCKSAIPLFKEAEAIYKRNKTEKTDRYLKMKLGIAICYANVGEYEKAYSNYDEAYGVKIDLIRKSNQELTRTLETRFQTKEKEQEIALLMSQNKLAEEQKANQRNLFAAGLIILILVSSGLYLLYRNKQKTNRKLQELDKLKAKFFANVSHEFRTPLSLILATVQRKMEDNDLSEKDREHFEMIHRNNNRLIDLVDQLLDLSKIEAGNLKLKVEKNNGLHFIAAISESFNLAAEQKDIEYQCQIEQGEKELWFDRDAMEKIIVNLLSNAIKYTPQLGRISCQVYNRENQLYIAVENTGKGLSEEQRRKVFERFYQADDQGEGTGIGLALVKELISMHKGEITVESEPEKLTRFKIVIPVDKRSYEENELQTAGKDQVKIQEAPSPEVTEEDNWAGHAQEKPILLIVEDNTDVRKVLKDTFYKNYQIAMAKNGLEGVTYAIEQIPDLIISDIMMPGKDGISLARELKNDERTSHIPIILLTAKAGEENELSGIETGADDYITKPFNTNILVSKVANLINLRKQLQYRYSQEVILKPQDIAITKPDESFLEKVQSVLEDKLVDPSFTIENFGEMVGMSRMQLHRKLKALTGLSASEFIRSQRLKLAAQILKQSEDNISQVGYSVGFNNHSYFTKCFRETYGYTPTEYAKKA